MQHAQGDVESSVNISFYHPGGGGQAALTPSGTPHEMVVKCGSPRCEQGEWLPSPRILQGSWGLGRNMNLGLVPGSKSSPALGRERWHFLCVTVGS